jgi:hypothetical protein
MVLLGDNAKVDAWFTSIGDSANLDASRRTVCDECFTGSKIVLDAPDGTPMLTRLMWRLDSVCPEIVPIFTKDRCTVCAKRTTAVETILDAPDGTPR